MYNQRKTKNILTALTNKISTPVEIHVLLKGETEGWNQQDHCYVYVFIYIYTCISTGTCHWVFKMARNS